MRPHRPLVFSPISRQTRNDRSPCKTNTLKASGLSVLPLCGMNRGKEGGQQCGEQKPPPAAPEEAALSETYLLNRAGRGGRYSGFPHPYESAAQSFCTWL